MSNMAGALTMKTEWSGWLTDFKFGELEIATREVMGSFGAIIYLAGILYTAKNLYLLVDLILAYRVLASILAIINPVVAVLILIIAYFSLQGLESFRMLNPGADHSGRLIPIFLFSGLLAFQAIVEVKALHSVRVFLRD